MTDDAVATLSRYCARLAIVPLGATRWLRAFASLVRGGTVTEGAFRAPALQATLAAWARQTRFQGSLLSSSGMIPYYLGQRELRDVPAVIDLVDVDSQKWFDYAAASRGPRAWLYRLEGRRLRRLEQGLPSWARAVTLISEAEVDLYRQFCAPVLAQAIPQGVDLSAAPPGPAAGEACVFIGALDYRPNIDGVLWFSREVWPHVHARRPNARFVVVGRKPAPAVLRLGGQPGIDLVGQVPDVRPYLERAAAVFPLRIARGVQNKVLEAMAAGKPVVASSLALAGLGAESGVHALTADDAGEWAEAIHRVLGDAELRGRLGAAGRRYVEEYHNWDHCLEPLGTLLGLAADEAGHGGRLAKGGTA